MFGGNLDDEFVNTVTKDIQQVKGSSSWPLLLIILFGIIVFIVWAWITEIEEVTSGQGRVIPSGQLQVVQTLEGGIVRDILVSEGDLVKAGQVLIKIDDTGFSSTLGELREQENALVAERYRLRAETKLKNELEIPQEFLDQNQVSVLAQKGVFLSRKRQLSNELEVLENRLFQRQFELDELKAQEVKLVTSLAPLEKEAELTRRMVTRGVVPEIEMLRLESRLAELQGDLAINKAAQPRVLATIEEAKNLKNTTSNNYVALAQERLARLEAELAVIKESLKAASDRVSRSQLRSPVAGIINRISVTTIGAVVQPAKDIVEIVPVDEGLLVEVKIRPQDVAFIKPEEIASVKITAYDYLIYGDLKGKVSRIGADTETDQDGEEFYQVIVKTDKNHLGEVDKPLPIIPGMVASVDIKTGTNSVFSSLMKPVLRAKKEALR
ncbi:MAG: HlyD family type I secretion periplasmic adaptor subunit [Pseudomonadota bacterium]